MATFTPPNGNFPKMVRDVVDLLTRIRDYVKIVPDEPPNSERQVIRSMTQTQVDDIFALQSTWRTLSRQTIQGLRGVRNSAPIYDTEPIVVEPDYYGYYTPNPEPEHRNIPESLVMLESVKGSGSHVMARLPALPAPSRPGPIILGPIVPWPKPPKPRPWPPWPPWPPPPPMTIFPVAEQQYSYEWAYYYLIQNETFVDYAFNRARFQYWQYYSVEHFKHFFAVYRYAATEADMDNQVCKPAIAELNRILFPRRD